MAWHKHADHDDGTPVLGFDMGGTSTDVAQYAGAFEHSFESTIAEVTIQIPQLDINTVAAGVVPSYHGKMGYSKLVLQVQRRPWTCLLFQRRPVDSHGCEFPLGKNHSGLLPKDSRHEYCEEKVYGFGCCREQ